MHKPTTELIEKTLEKLAQRQQPVFPAMVPITVGCKVIYRNYCSVVAVDAAAGSIEWKSMTVAGLDALLCDANKKDDLRSWLTRYGDQSQENILFESSMIGTLSADHDRVYAIDDLALPAHPSGFVNQLFGFGEPAQAMLSTVNRSRLVAINLETGKIDWERGQPVFDRSELADSYFLGPPLPVAGMLYVMTEKKGDLQLACLNPEDGKPLWVMKLDKAGEELAKDVRRRLHAVQLAYATGVLVCPTHDGTIFGIDPAMRRIKWAFAYREKVKPPADKGKRAIAPVLVDPKDLLGDWKFPGPVIHGDKVVFTAPDSKAIYCLNLKDGALFWKAEQRDDLYVAGIFQGKVLVVGKQSCRALNLTDGGKQLWQSATGLPSGIGFASAANYFLPLRKGKVIAVEVASGRIVAESSGGEEVPGNLILYKDKVVSQTETEIACFPQAKPK
jgi:outer membrane protein assembly factor BamB